MRIAVTCPCDARVRLNVERGNPVGWHRPDGSAEAAPVYECECGRTYRATDAHPWIEPVSD